MRKLSSLLVIVLLALAVMPTLAGGEGKDGPGYIGPIITARGAGNIFFNLPVSTQAVGTTVTVKAFKGKVLLKKAVTKIEEGMDAVLLKLPKQTRRVVVKVHVGSLILDGRREKLSPLSLDECFQSYIDNVWYGNPNTRDGQATNVALSVAGCLSQRVEITLGTGELVAPPLYALPGLFPLDVHLPYYSGSLGFSFYWKNKVIWRETRYLSEGQWGLPTDPERTCSIVSVDHQQMTIEMLKAGYAGAYNLGNPPMQRDGGWGEWLEAGVHTLDHNLVTELALLQCWRSTEVDDAPFYYDPGVYFRVPADETFWWLAAQIKSCEETTCDVLVEYSAAEPGTMKVSSGGVQFIQKAVGPGVYNFNVDVPRSLIGLEGQEYCEEAICAWWDIKIYDGTEIIAQWQSSVTDGRVETALIQLPAAPVDLRSN